MAKKTLLDIVQDILIDIGSERVNAISDTEEAEDVARIVRNVYMEMIDNSDWPHLRILFNPTGLATVATPTHLMLEDNIQKIDNETIWYDVRENALNDPTYRNIIYLEPDEFLDYVMPRASNLSDANVQEVTSPVKFYIYNDRGPRYCTSFDDKHLIFDSFDSGVEATLVGAKCNILGYREPTFSLTDNYVPDLPSKNFSELVAEATSVAMVSVAQEADPKREQMAQRIRKRMEIQKWRTRGGIRFQNNFGR